MHPKMENQTIKRRVNKAVMSYRKIFFGILGLIILPIISIFAFYIYMIYFTHSWDEGSTHTLCGIDPKTHNMVLIEKTIIRNGEEIKVTGSNSECTS